MPTCPRCGSIVMEGDPYCSHCGAHFKWSYFDEEDDSDYRTSSESAYNEPVRHDSYDCETDYGGSSSYDSYNSETDSGEEDHFLDYGEVSETYLDVDDEKMEYIASHIYSNPALKSQLKVLIRKFQKAPHFNGFYIRKEYGFEVYYFHFIQENEYVKTTHVMITHEEDDYCKPCTTFYETYSKHDHEKLIANPRFKKLIESTGFEFDRCGGGYELREGLGYDWELGDEIEIRVYFKVGSKKRSYKLNLDEMELCQDYYEYDPNDY